LPERDAMERFIVIGGLILQSAIAKISPLVGGVVGLIVTGFVSLWGASVYANGGIMMIFAIELPAQIFYMICIAWAIYDVRSIIDGWKKKNGSASADVLESAQSRSSAIVGGDGLRTDAEDRTAIAAPSLGDAQPMIDSGKCKEELWHELSERFEVEIDEARKRDIAKTLVDLGFLYYKRFL
jgi:hypothetical protein